MKNILLLTLCLPILSSCGAMGQLVGTVARLPVDIVKAGTGLYDEGEIPPELSDEFYGDFSGTVPEPSPLGYAD